jgi:CBS-domain-containing membrane protein
MSKGIVTIDTAASCHKAVERMFHHKVRHLPVTGSDGQVIGIVTDRDLRHHLLAVGAFEHRIETSNPAPIRFDKRHHVEPGDLGRS